MLRVFDHRVRSTGRVLHGAFPIRAPFRVQRFFSVGRRERQMRFESEQAERHEKYKVGVSVLVKVLDSWTLSGGRSTITRPPSDSELSSAQVCVD